MRQRAGGLQHHAFDIQHLDDGHADRVFGHQHAPDRPENPSSACEVEVTDAGDGGAVDEIVDLGERHRRARPRGCASGSARPPARVNTKRVAATLPSR